MTFPNLSRLKASRFSAQIFSTSSRTACSKNGTDGWRINRPANLENSEAVMIFIDCQGNSYVFIELDFTLTLIPAFSPGEKVILWNAFGCPLTSGLIQFMVPMRIYYRRSRP